MERGELGSMKNSVLSNNVQGSTTIISIVPEGTLVKEGDIVCVLDSSKLKDKEVSQLINVTQAKANRDNAEQNVKIQKVKNESNIEAENLDLALAELDLEKYIKREARQLEEEQEGKVTLAKLELTRAQESYEFTKRLAKKGYKSQIDLEAERISVTRRQLDLRSAEGKFEVLMKYTHKRTIKELEDKARDSKSDLKRMKLSNAASLAQFESDLEARKLNYQVEISDLARVREQIEFCTMRAPQDGEVVYATQNSRRSDSVIIEEGVTVRERQAIINLPDFSQMKVDTRIHESRISLVREALPATIKIDAFPDQDFTGYIDSISAVPVSSNWFQPDLREYEAIVKLNLPPETNGKLKPGLTAEVEILVDQRDDVLTVPVQAVIAVGTKKYIYVLSNAEPQRREVITGDSNDLQIEIVDGIKAGENVILNPRTHFNQQIANLESKLLAEKTKNQLKGKHKLIIPRKPAPGTEQKSPRKDRSAPDKSPRSKVKGKPAKPQKKNNSNDLIKKLDKDGDGKLAVAEVPQGLKDRFSKIDANSDGFIDQTELRSAFKPRGQNR